MQSRIALIGGCVLKKSRGQPKVFEEQEFKDFVFQYLNEVYQNQNSDDPDIPTFFGFYNFVKQRKECSYHTVRRCFDEYWADIKKDFQDVRADLLVRGAMLYKYNPTMSIFGLKNWCGWSDSGRVVTGRYDEEKAEDALSKALREEAERMQADAD